MSTNGNVVKLPRRTARKPAERRAQPAAVNTFPLAFSPPWRMIELDCLRIAGGTHTASYANTLRHFRAAYKNVPDAAIEPVLESVEAYMRRRVARYKADVEFQMARDPKSKRA